MDFLLLLRFLKFVDVCRKVMMKRVPDDEEFWEVFRDVTRKLAARCRRVRHSKKTLKNKGALCLRQCGGVGSNESKSSQ